jgi:hypothetical protein
MLELLTMWRKWMLARRAKRLMNELMLNASRVEINRLRAYHQEA